MIKTISNQQIVTILILGSVILLLATLLPFIKKEQPAENPRPSEFRMLSVPEQQKIIGTISEKDPEGAWRYLLDAATDNGRVVIDAHNLGHLVGNAMYRNHGIKGVTMCTTEFAYACMHGVTEMLFTEKGPDAVSEVETGCRQFFMSNNEAVYQGLSGCIHGAGHGLLSFHSYEIPDALDACDAFGTDVIRYCYDGVFMEAAQGGAPAVERALQSDPWSLCRDLSGDSLTQCSRYLPVAVREKKVRAREWNPLESHTAELLSLCNDANTHETTLQCIKTVGHMLAQSLHETPNDIVEECDTDSETHRSECLSAAATEVSFQRYNNRETAVALLCDAITDQNMGRTCLEDADRTYAQEVN